MYINIYKNILARGLTYVGSTNRLTHQICHIGDLDILQGAPPPPPPFLNMAAKRHQNIVQIKHDPN